MRPETGRPVGHAEYRFALFTNGANFGCEVLRSLLELQCPPELLILPGYPPAPMQVNTDILAPAAQGQLAQLAASLETGYAAEALQAQCASLLRQRAVDFILVACWPYLIDANLIESARKAAVNLHPSMLPAYRGADPVAEQLANAEQRFGVSLHLLNQHFDRGDIVDQAELAETSPNPSRSWLERQCARDGAGLFIGALHDYDAGWRPSRQPD